MTRTAAANAIGLIGLACSLVFWADVVPYAFWGVNTPKLSFNGFLATQALGVALAFVASAIGSRRWLIAACFAVLNLFCVLVLISR